MFRNLPVATCRPTHCGRPNTHSEKLGLFAWAILRNGPRKYCYWGGTQSLLTRRNAVIVAAVTSSSLALRPTNPKLMASSAAAHFGARSEPAGVRVTKVVRRSVG